MKWSPEDDAILCEMHGLASFEEIAAAVGRKITAVKWRVTKLGIAKRQMWTPEEEAALIDLYAKAGDDGFLNLKAFADKIGRDDGNVARKAISLGLHTNPLRAKTDERKVRVRMFETDADRAAFTSERMKAWFAENGHPKGMLGKRHTPETLAILSQRSRDNWLFTPEHKKDEAIDKAMKTRVANHGFIAPKVARGSWKAGWREVGSQRAYFRSRWEANYARYLEWLRTNGQIASWKHEPKTFWFENIKRGVRSYLPDFEVTEPCGAVRFHEVKGWMDARSKTTIKRFRKYYPEETLIVIDTKGYEAIKRKVSGLIEGWEQ